MFADVACHCHLLGDGNHPAPQRGRHDQGDRQRRVRPGQHRQARSRVCARCAATRTSRATAPWASGRRCRTTSSTRCSTSSTSTRRASTVTTPSTRSARCATGDARVFMGMGGNFVSATPDTVVTEEAMRSATLTVQVSTKLNRSHVVCGDTALILPVLGRSEKDLTGGREQRVTRRGLDVGGARLQGAARSPPVTSCGRRSRSSVVSPRRRCPTSATSRGRSSEPTTPTSATPSRGWCRAVRRTRRRSTGRAASSCPTRRATPGRSPPRRTRRSSRSARSTCCTCPKGGCCCRRCAATTSSTPRSTASTTATAASRTAAGSSSSIPTTSPPWGCSDGEVVDLISEWKDGTERSAPEFRVVAYDTPRGCAAAYYPETNPLVPLDSTAHWEQLSDVEVDHRPVGGRAQP